MKYSIEDLNPTDKKVFLRVDFNVPLDEDRKITDTTRIDASLPTIRKLLAKGSKLFLVSHLGRPKGRDEKLSLQPIAAYLSKKLNQAVRFAPQILGEVAAQAVAEVKKGECLVFENIRFYKQEEANDPAFSQEVAKLFDLYVNDAFGTAHRAHASTYGIPEHFATPAAGDLMFQEIHFLTQALTNKNRPYVAILGGAKVKDKIPVIENLLDKVDSILIGGGMAYSFLKFQQKPIGNSIYDAESAGLIEAIYAKAKALKKNILLPVDHVVGKDLKDNQPKTLETIPDGLMGLDIGPKTLAHYKEALKPAKFVIWNGPMGVFENPLFQTGTFEIAKALSALKDHQATTIVGGGDSVAAIHQAGVADRITHVSTGGGASLEFLEGKQLPGIQILKDKA